APARCPYPSAGAFGRVQPLLCAGIGTGTITFQSNPSARTTSLVRCDISLCAKQAPDFREPARLKRVRFGPTQETSWGNALTKPDRIFARSVQYDTPRGLALLRDPLLNKGTAFTEQERDALGLRGFLPAAVMSMQVQAERILTGLRGLSSDLEKYI